MDGWSFSSLGSGVVALEGVDTEAPSAGAGGADGAASLAGAFVLQCGGGGVDGDVSSFAGAFVDVDAMVGIYSPSAVAFGGVQVSHVGTAVVSTAHLCSFAGAFEQRDGFVGRYGRRTVLSLMAMWREAWVRRLVPAARVISLLICWSI